jgi:WhiB family transcriptional regulator, redox-sensing transcriptional regulator
MTRARLPRPHEIAAARRDPRLLRAFHERQDTGAWRTRGVCQGVDPETFFPAPSEPADAAIALCRSCDVQGACLAWALEVGDCHGVWGATTPRERRAMLVAWRADSRPEPAVDLPPTIRPAAPVPAVTAAADGEALPVLAPAAAVTGAAAVLAPAGAVTGAAAVLAPAGAVTGEAAPALAGPGQRARSAGTATRPASVAASRRRREPADRVLGLVPEQSGHAPLGPERRGDRRPGGDLVERVAS